MKITFLFKSTASLVFSCAYLTSLSQAQVSSSEPVRILLTDLANSKAEITYTHEKLKNGLGRTATIEAILQIKSKKDEGFIASWTSKSVKVDEVLIDENSPQAGSMLLGVPLDFLTGAVGGPIKLIDRENLFAKLPDSAAFANSDPKTIEQVMNFYKSMDEDTIANTFFKVPSFMSVCQDTNFTVGEVNVFTTKQPSPFGEGVLIGNVSYELTSLDTANNVAHISYRSKFDKESMTELAMQSLKKLAPDAPISQKEIDEIIIDRNDSADCEVDLSTGWVKRMKYTTFIDASGETAEQNFDISVNWIE